MHDRFNTRIFLFIDFLGSRYMGSMQFDDPKFCYELYTLLKSKVRRQIKEIGDLDLSYTL